jgi:8-oxo-dGTP pyrophosphatase MutT (NUDIX family)
VTPRRATSVPEFGTREAGAAYRARPGSYGVILDDAGRVAVLRTRSGLYLPGGGAHPGETPEATLEREVREECGRDVRILGDLGLATEYVRADREGYFAKHCTFFHAAFGRPVTPDARGEHPLLWLPRAEAIERLSHGSQSWAVARVEEGHRLPR